MPQGSTVTETQEFRQSFTQNGSNPSSFESVTVDIICYRGKKVIETRTSFMDNDPSEFTNSNVRLWLK